MTKEEVLQGALELNGDDKKYIIRLDGDRIITEVKYMDAVLFAPGSVTDEMKNFRSIACLNDDKTYVELHEIRERSHSAGTSGLRFSNYGSFGKVVHVKKSISFGSDKDTGKIGVIKVDFNSEDYKKPVRDYLESCGYKKTNRGFFKRLFGK